MEANLLLKIHSLLAQANDPDLNDNQLVGHQMNVIYEIKLLIDEYHKKLARGMVK